MYTVSRSNSEIIKSALAVLKEFGANAAVERWNPEFGGNHTDAEITLERGDLKEFYKAEIRRGLRAATLPAVIQHLKRLGDKTLLIADYVTPQMAEILRNQGIAFVDAAGNAFLEHPSLLVWSRGNRPKDQPNKQLTGRAFQPGGLLVQFTLLCNPELVDSPYRRIAKLAGVAHGTVGMVMMDLEKLGFIGEKDRKRRLLQPGRLLQLWVEAYAHTLRPRILLGRYTPETLAWWSTLDPVQYNLIMGGEGAAARILPHMRPETLTFYGQKAEPRFRLHHFLKEDPAGKVEILKKFWEFDSLEPGLAPTLLVYADLLAIGSERCLDAAGRLYDRIIDRFGIF